MIHMISMQIISIDNTSKYLLDIKALWRANSKTLGYFPDGAFDEHASKGLIIAAINEDGDLEGYLLYRIVHRGKIWPAVIIVHLCIEEKYRNHRTAKSLIEYIRGKTKQDHLGIGLWCRRDYDAHSFWQKTGFIPRNERVGRSGESLTFWWMDFNRPSLFNQPVADSKVQAVIDANVFYDLQDDVSDKTEESKALMADWLSNEVVLSVTGELFNEIDRNPDSNQREKRRGFAQGFTHIQTEAMKVDEAITVLSKILPPSQELQDHSDLMQLAHTIAGGVNFFITRDRQLLDISDELHESLNIRVISPGYFIGQLDEVVREAEYQPKNLAGTKISGTKIRSTDTAELEQNFLCSNKGEKGSAFAKKIKSFISNPTRYNTQLIRDPDNRPLAIIVYDIDPSELRIPMVRVSRHQLSGTITRHILNRAILHSAEKKIPFTCVTDEFIQDGIVDALVESGFSQTGDGWIKVNITYARNMADLLDVMRRLKSQRSEINDLLDKYISFLERSRLDDTFTLAEMEKSLWPMKILDAYLLTFLIPIRSIWAQHLFDEKLATQTFWGADPETMLRTENIYYRSCAFGSKIRAPSRILWYISSDDKVPYTKCVRACSSLDEIIIGRAKILYKRFNRLGIYRWEQIKKIAGDDPERNIMALRFSRTEQFPNPVSLQKLKTIYQMHDVGKNFSLQSPLLISSKAFAEIYELSYL